MIIVQILAYYPPHIGGMELRVKELTDELIKNKINVEVYTSDIGLPQSYNKKSNPRIYYLKAIEVGHTVILPTLFFRLLKLPKKTIMHVHIAHAFVPEIVFLVSKIKKIPYIAHIRIDQQPSGKWGLLLPLYLKHVLRPILNNASKLIVHTKDYKELIHYKYGIPYERIVLIPNATNFKSNRQEYKRLHNPIKILFVGRLSKQKNLPLLLDAFEILLKKYKINVSLDIVGKGEELTIIKDLIFQKELEDHVVLHGELTGDELYMKYEVADIFVFPTKYESFSTVLLEALACGIPVVASDISSVRNIIRKNKNGLLCTQNAEDFAEAIMHLICDATLRKKLILQGFITVKKYRWPKLIKKFLHLYREVSNELLD